MYHCENCDRFFDKPILISDSHGLPWVWRETFRGCPYCRCVGMIGVIDDDAP